MFVCKNTLLICGLMLLLMLVITYYFKSFVLSSNFTGCARASDGMYCWQYVRKWSFKFCHCFTNRTDLSILLNPELMQSMLFQVMLKIIWKTYMYVSATKVFHLPPHVHNTKVEVSFFLKRLFNND